MNLDATMVETAIEAIQEESPEGLHTKIATLESELDSTRTQLRQLKHQTAFAKVAQEAGAYEDVIDDLFKLSGWICQTDEPDKIELGKTVSAIKQAKPRFFRGEAEISQISATTTGKTALDSTFSANMGVGLGASQNSAPGGKRGNSTTTDDLRISLADLANPEFVMSRKPSEIAAAIRRGIKI